ncbi:MAG: hypothetical protein HY277_08965 [Ignavibacteriales bacterium]|nr:hypothetical protein [Ignavibacteriales bacterium]
MESKHYRWLALGGIIGCIPAMMIVTLGMSQVLFGLTDVGESIGLTAQGFILHPILVLGGLFVAIGLNVTPVFRIQVQSQAGAMTTMITTHWKTLNVVVLLLGLVLLCSILGYAFTENFRIVPR